MGTGLRSYNVAFCILCYENRDVLYSTDCHNSSNLFGCVGLRNKQYCILNTQYTQKEYELLIPKIIARMQQD
ncbi:MAG: hypothetical protein H6767_02090 [Candidatus Peribacteria bacterium]|nr:MAG: hypothetical protein H6767_02090 [Candidatus Peribacteria bacterium]